MLPIPSLKIQFNNGILLVLGYKYRYFYSRKSKDERGRKSESERASASNTQHVEGIQRGSGCRGTEKDVAQQENITSFRWGNTSYFPKNESREACPIRGSRY